MALTQAQAARQKTPQSPSPEDQGEQGSSAQLIGREASHTQPATQAISDQDTLAVSENRRRKRSAEQDSICSQLSKRRQTSRASEEDPASSINKGADDIVSTVSDPIASWVRDGRWPGHLFEPEDEMDRLLAKKRSSSNLSRKRSSSGTSITPSDQKPREEKSAEYRDPRYETLLATKGTFLKDSKSGITDESKQLIKDLLAGNQPHPTGTLFDDSIFADACQNVKGKNEARVMVDLTRLIVPSAESIALRAHHLKNLVESVNEGWNNSVPLTGRRPQPDYSVGFSREAFSEDQLARLSPFLGNFTAGDQSYFMATHYMYFPFLTCEVKCGAAALQVAERQNAHSMTLSVRAVAELLRLVNRGQEAHRQILAFSITHDDSMVRIYGHYPEINGNDIKYYSHLIHFFSFTALEGREKWTAYDFTKNVYEKWAPGQFKRICEAIDQLPVGLDFDVPPLTT